MAKIDLISNEWNNEYNKERNLKRKDDEYEMGRIA